MLDFDGTVVDTETAVYRSWAELWDDHGLELDLVYWKSTLGTKDRFDPFDELQARLGRVLDPSLVEHRMRRRDEILAAERPRPGVVSWLEHAEREGIAVGVASSSSLEWVDGQLRRLGLRELVRTLVCHSDAVPAKPDPTSFRLACEQLKAAPALSVAVEDSHHGVSAAIGAGLFTVAVPNALTADLDFAHAQLVLRSLAELTLAEALDLARTRGLVTPAEGVRSERSSRPGMRPPP